ncbi:hypothetical protein AM500_05120 [Bacillus sp. FJAT-18017]|uniref:Ig-like domain-containing protein n=1 Tax=Bacillus sp. FJAT-18017 TaxID=1705566 RepID=UPI0006ADDDB8|nr:Ig-like domain-containing protein [Bacillus sp. FJAT-18017]ALC89232.1 hypothetical protein AM500_05120 [Bacillus sp. FJAT-18017]
MKKVFSIMVVILLVASTISLSPKAVKAETSSEVEDNDSFSKANGLSLTASPYESGVFTAAVNGTIFNDSYYSDDYDYYRITLTNPGKLTIKITPKQDTNFQVVLYDSSQSRMEDWHTYFNDSTEPIELFSNGLKSGTYFIRVSHYEGNYDKVPYQLEVDFTPSENYEQEDNDSRSKANWIKTGTVYNGFGDSDYNEDYFAFTVDKNSEVKVNLSRSATERFQINLFDVSGNELEGWYTYYNDSTDLIEVIHTGLPQGTYYIKIDVYENDKYNIPYSFSVNVTANSAFETEPNHGESTADVITVGQQFSGVIGYDDDVDYYRVTIPTKMDLALYMSQSDSHRFGVSIYQQGSSYWYADDYSTEYGKSASAKVTNLSLNAGTYFIWIQGDEGSFNKVPYSFKLVERDTTPPAAPVVSTITDKSSVITGTAEANSTIIVRQGSTIIKTGKAGKDGKFSIGIPAKTGGTTLYVTAKDAEGNESLPAKIIVKDTTAPKAPSVNEVKDKDIKVTGKTEAYAKVTVKSGSTVIAQGTADKNGNYSLALKKSQKAGTVLTVSSQDKAGNTSVSTKVTVKDKTPPAIPTVNKVTVKSATVTGKTEPNATVYVKANNRVIGQAKAGKTGTYSVKIPKQKYKTTLYVYAKDTAGNIGSSRKVTVQK